MTFTRIKNTTKYVAIKELSESGYSVSALCKLAEITRAAYYKWKNRKNSINDDLNERLQSPLKKFMMNIQIWVIEESGIL